MPFLPLNQQRQSTFVEVWPKFKSICFSLPFVAVICAYVQSEDFNV